MICRPTAPRPSGGGSCSTPSGAAGGGDGGASQLLIAHARALGIRRLRCEVLAGNAVAAGLYGRLGFVATGSYEQEGRRFLQLALPL